MDCNELHDSANNCSAEEVAEHLRRGEVVAVGTDTVLGLLADANLAKAVRRLDELKGRPKSKPYVRVVADVEQVRGEVLLSPLARRLIRAHWPGALTIVFPTPSGKTLGVRMPKDNFLSDLIRGYDGALVMTSANHSSEPECRSREEVWRCFGRKVRNCVPENVEVLVGTRPSTVVALSKDGLFYSVLREGSVLLDGGSGD